jgi:hypothetical protein
MLVLESEHVSPVEGEMVVARATVPVKPLSGATVRVEVPVAPPRIGTEVGFAVRVKSDTGAATLIVRVALVLTRAPEVALT